VPVQPHADYGLAKGIAKARGANRGELADFDDVQVFFR
jgi:hypothetical protein